MSSRISFSQGRIYIHLGQTYIYVVYILNIQLNIHTRRIYMYIMIFVKRKSTNSGFIVKSFVLRTQRRNFSEKKKKTINHVTYYERVIYILSVAFYLQNDAFVFYLYVFHYTTKKSSRSSIHIYSFNAYISPI